MANIIPEETTRLNDPNDTLSQIREYVKAKASLDFLKERTEALKSAIFDYIDSNGEEDSNGSIKVNLPASIDGVFGLQKNRRATRTLDELVADEIIEAAGIGDQVYEMKRVINEEALMAAFYDEKITEEQLDAMFPVKVVWALRTLKK
jgi:hypothetical protein